MLDKDERYYRPLLQDGHEQPLPVQGLTCKGYAIVSTILLILSISMNVKFIVAEFLSTNNHRTEYGNLAEEIMLPWTNTTDYTSSNQTLSDEMFKALNTDDGVIAVDPEWAAARGLPPSTGRFPWDTKKRVYVVNGYHGIHCIAQLHRSLREYRDGLPQSHAFEHNNHCLDWLRNDIICHADDTPLYTDNTRHSTNGIGQMRQCRDWGQLEKWAKTHHACFRYGNFVVDEKKEDQVGRFKFCPDDSPYLARVRSYYGKGEDWFPSHIPYGDVE